MTGIAMLNSSFGGAAPAALVLNLDAAVGALPGSALTTSASFDGSTQYLNIANNAKLGLGTGDFTIEYWWRPTSNVRSDVVDLWGVGGGGANNATRLIFGSSVTGSSLGIWVDSTPTSIVYNAISGPTLSSLLNSWHHIALTRQSGSIKMWVDGTQAGSTYSAATLDFGASQAMNIMGDHGVGSGNGSGNLSNLRVVLGTALYTTTFTPPTATLLPVTGTAVLLPLTAAPFMDMSTNNATVTNVGTTSTTASAPTLSVPNTDLLNTAVTKYNTNSTMAWATTTGGIFRKTTTGTADFLTFGPDYSATSKAYTVMMVYRTGSTAGRLLNANSASPDWLMGVWGSPSHVQNIFFNGNFVGASNTAATGAWTFQWVTYNGRPAAAVSNSYVATSSQPTTTFGTGSTSGGFNQLRLFGRFVDATTISEVGVYDTALVKVWDGVLTLAQIQAQYAAYKSRFGY